MPSSHRHRNKQHANSAAKHLNDSVLIAESPFIRLLERVQQDTAAECFRHFEKFYREKWEFQRKIQRENHEYDRQRREIDRQFQKKLMRHTWCWRIGVLVLVFGALYWLI